MRIYCHPWTIVEVCTAQQDFGSRKRLIRVRYRLRPSGYMKSCAALALLAAVAAAGWQSWPMAVAALVPALLCGGLWLRGANRASQALAVFDYLAHELRFVRCQPEAWLGEQQRPG